MELAMKNRNYCLLLLALGLAACSVGPDYKRPELTVPAAYKEAGDWQVAQPNDASVRGNWWAIFADPALDDLMAQVSISNQNLALAEARYRQAKGLSDAARANFFPTISLNASSKRAANGGGAAASQGLIASPSVQTSHSVSAGISWEADIWGKLRRQAESNDWSALASAADLEAARLSTQAELAADYFQLRVSDSQKQLFEETVAAFDKSLQLTRNRYAAGVAGKVDVVQAETQLLSAQAQMLDLDATRATLEHAIAVLVGKAPANFAIARAPAWAPKLPSLPVGLPSALLERRADVAAAERRAMAANAQIGVAQSAWFPSLTFSASDGYTSSTLAKWISAPNRAWSAGPALAETIFDFGKRGAVTEQAVASYDQAAATYKQAVLQAFQDVEDNLSNLHFLAQEAKVQEEAVRAARESVTLTINQYKAGTVNYLSVVTVQTAQFNNERTLASLAGRRLQATVGLVKALGGGWQASEGLAKP